MQALSADASWRFVKCAQDARATEEHRVRGGVRPVLPSKSAAPRIDELADDFLGEDGFKRGAVSVVANSETARNCARERCDIRAAHSVSEGVVEPGDVARQDLVDERARVVRQLHEVVVKPLLARVHLADDDMLLL